MRCSGDLALQPLPNRTQEPLYPPPCNPPPHVPQDYTFKGLLVGKFYTPEGKPRGLLRHVEEQALKAKSEEERQAEMDKVFPRCNVRWSEHEGGCGGGGGHECAWLCVACAAQGGPDDVPLPCWWLVAAAQRMGVAVD